MFDFPNAPTNGQIAIGPGGISYVYDGTKWASTAAAGTAYAPLASPVFTGDPQAPTPASTDSDTSIATTAFVQAVAAPFGNNTGRNLLHNGRFDVAQRGAGPWTANGYTADRWRLIYATSDTRSVSRIAISDADRANIGDEAATFALANAFTGSAAAGSYQYVHQPIEGVRRLAGKTVILSFWANAVAATKLGINMAQVFGTGGSPSSSVWALATGLSVTVSGSAFARYSVTFSVPSISGKTLGTNGDDCISLAIWYSSTSGTNALAGNIGVQSGTVNIWGVQLELGSTATPLAKRDPADELALCQRFYQTGAIWLGGAGGATYGTGYQVAFPVIMRAGPTVALNMTTQSNCSGTTPSTPFAGGFVAYTTVTGTSSFAMAGTFTASADL